ncbi:bifunctional 2-polyprenyl-6-hydroxyphenol methylase/3-demethylubiquinol 3-O-methyltransferase UbiG [Hyphomicrobiales bacterium]|jgi:2-polyprenyl-6-hydroxyphenyl methylase/3-demethylubiquinone-9 3-methyltransferase|nr:bifunctional 2-polyprenyl-6-hydroxyphenol methylase/3-demethylubiquinol 3-O-methyltransferase UbiG [Hyphomicrobiales bacterium]
MAAKETIDPDEILKFSNISDEWWKVDGKFSALHKINPIRVKFIIDKITSHLNISNKYSNLLHKVNILDVGCGGGLLCEPLARLDANVTGIDADKKSLNVAISHAKDENLSINYTHLTLEDIIKAKKKYDVVLAMEVIEHVDNIEHFILQLSNIINPNGIIIFSSINRTIKSFLLAIIGAEYILRWVPTGTHNWNKFITPEELEKMLKINNIKLIETKGVVFNPIKYCWTASNDSSVNYMIAAKPKT